MATDGSESVPFWRATPYQDESPPHEEDTAVYPVEDPRVAYEIAYGRTNYGAPEASELEPISTKQRQGELRIHNVLASAKLQINEKLDLYVVSGLFKNTYYDPSEFPAVRIEVKGSLTGSTYVVTLFDQGTIQTTGGCMPREAALCMKKVAKRLSSKLKINPPVRFMNFEVQNLLAVVDFATEIRLAALKNLFPGKADYEPERFPALHVRIPVPPAATAAGAAAVTSSASSATGDEPLRQKRITMAERKRQARVPKQKKPEEITANIFGNGKINIEAAS